MVSEMALATLGWKKGKEGKCAGIGLYGPRGDGRGERRQGPWIGLLSLALDTPVPSRAPPTRVRALRAARFADWTEEREGKERGEVMQRQVAL